MKVGTMCQMRSTAFGGGKRPSLNRYARTSW
jgi:hypothetical protein